MAAPVYFFPQVTRASVLDRGKLRASFLAGRGVAAAFAGVTDVDRQATCYDLPGRGPGGRSGLILQVVGDPAPVRVGYAENHQTWHERPAGCDCWVGIDNDYPPTPAELAIGAPRGYPLELGDGQIWKIPVVRSPLPGRADMPFDFVYDQAGQLQQVRRESALWELSEHGWNHYFDRANYPTISDEVLIDLVLGSLALNYRLGKVEQTVLRLINSTNWSRCLELLLDVPLLEEREAASQKKTEDQPPASSSASPGAGE